MGQEHLLRGQMVPSIVAHWRRLSGEIHETDVRFFSERPHSFNLDYPPPAYVGDIINAPVVLLDKNGGYDPEITPREFMGVGAVEKYLDLLHNPRAVDPRQISPYYAARSYCDLIAAGRLALVNAVAYRSKSLSREPENERLAKLLPSTAVHIRWLRNELLPEAMRGDRLVIAHRSALWGLRREEAEQYPGTVVVSRNPVSPDLAHSVLALAAGWRGRQR